MIRCRLFGHVRARPGRGRCARCDSPVGADELPESPVRVGNYRQESRHAFEKTLNREEAVLLEALGAIRSIGVSTGGTHHDACQHAPCIATRAIEKYWEIVLEPFEGKKP